MNEMIVQPRECRFKEVGGNNRNERARMCSTGGGNALFKRKTTIRLTCFRQPIYSVANQHSFRTLEAIEVGCEHLSYFRRLGLPGCAEVSCH